MNLDMKAVEAAMWAQGLESYQALYRRSGVSAQALSEHYRGYSVEVQVANAQALARALNVRVIDIVDSPYLHFLFEPDARPKSIPNDNHPYLEYVRQRQNNRRKNMKVYTLTHPDQLKVLAGSARSQEEAAHMRSFAVVWSAQRRKGPEKSPIRVTLELGRQAMLYREVNGTRRPLGTVKLSAARAFAKAHEGD